MTAASRLFAAVVATVVAFLLQVTVFPQFTWHGIVPGLVLLVVVGAALATDTRFATLLGFGAGLLVDLAPPADHTAGRWALALLIVGYVVGRLSHDHQPVPAGPLDTEQVRRLRRPPLLVVLAAAAGGSFVGNSAYALTGVLLGESGNVPALLEVIGAAVVLDTVAGIPVVLVTVWLFTRKALPRGARPHPDLPRALSGRVR